LSKIKAKFSRHKTVEERKTMDTIRGLFKLARPITTLTGILATFLGGYVADTGIWLPVALAALVTAMAQASANMWNDYLDVEIDRINQPHRVLPSGQVDPTMAWRVSVGLSVLGLVVAGFINLPAFLITLTSTIILYLYSWKLKSTVLMGNATVATISAMSVVFGGVAAGNVRPTLWLAIIIGVGILGREVLKTMADYEGDLSQDCKTVATVWGKKAARAIFFVLAVATFFVMVLPSILQIYKPIYLAVISIGVLPVMTYVLLRARPDATGRQLEKLSQLLKYDFLIWFLAVVLGAA
jgi:geranylgeranylglycerol-phosphate geranylgeranyltransferase